MRDGKQGLGTGYWGQGTSVHGEGELEARNRILGEGPRCIWAEGSHGVKRAAIRDRLVVGIGISLGMGYRVQGTGMCGYGVGTGTGDERAGIGDRHENRGLGTGDRAWD